MGVPPSFIAQTTHIFQKAKPQQKPSRGFVEKESQVESRTERGEPMVGPMVRKGSPNGLFNRSRGKKKKFSTRFFLLTWIQLHHLALH